MRFLAKLRAFSELISNLFHKPVTVRESFGFIADNSRVLPRRDEARCTGCGACNERCSSGATSITDALDQRTVSIDCLRCIFCARCADVCPEGALDLIFKPFITDEHRQGGYDRDDQILEVPVSRRYARKISLSHGIYEKKEAVDTSLVLQKCSVCGEMMPVSEVFLQVIRDRVLKNLQPENALIVGKDMEVYLTACISCRRKQSMIWNTHPRKFV